MPRHIAENERIKRIYFTHLKLSSGLSDPREVRTKNSKAQVTTFFPVGGTALQIVTGWIEFLIKERLRGPDDPLFPSTQITQGTDHRFASTGLTRDQWRNAGPIRKVFKEAFEFAGLPGFNPHSFRHALAVLAEKTCKTPEEFKAWSQNLGHEKVMTTFTSYGNVPDARQAEILKKLASPRADELELEAAARRLVKLARSGG